MSVPSTKVSVVIPCRNEQDYIEQCIETILDNGYRGELEVIAVDGRSTDCTRQVLRTLTERHSVVRVVDNPSGLTPVGLNLGIEAATGEVVVIMGAHCEAGPGYISTTVSRLLSDPTIGCVGGRTVPRAKGGALARAIAAVLQSRFGVGGAHYRVPTTSIRQVDTVAYGAYRRSVMLEIGLFDERLVRNQDMEFNTRLRRAGYRIILDPSVEVSYRPRRSLKAFWRQNFGNGYWAVLSWKMVPGSMSWRHFVPFLFASSVLLGTITGAFFHPVGLLTALVAVTYLAADAVEATRIALNRRDACLLATFLVFPVLHVSYGVGSVLGFLFVLRGGVKELGSPGRRSLRRS